MKYGFSGSREGMTRDQAEELVAFLRAQYDDITEWHDGDCIGADAQAHELVETLLGARCRMIGHPPDQSRYRAFLKYNESRLPLPYLVRDRMIVQETEILVACPKEMKEVLRSGTWTTIRQGLKTNLVFIILPNGKVKMNKRLAETFDGKAN